MMRKSSSSFQKPQSGKPNFDPFNDSNQLLAPGSPSSGRRVSFSIPEDSPCHSPKGGPSMSGNPFTESPTYHSPQIALNQILSVSTTSGTTQSLSLWSQLQSRFRPSEYGTGDIKAFLPRSAVDDLIDRHNVEEYWEGLKHLPSNKSLSNVLDYVFGTRNARSVFAIIVLMEANAKKPTTDRENTPFALKVLEAKDEVTFKLEVKALMKIRPNKHLVTAVTAFKYQDKYHLLFNWAEGGTLSDFWKNESPGLTHDSICWLAQQCHGLADGLCGIHNAQISVQELVDVDPQHEMLHIEANAGLNDHRDDKIHGRHGDIKPDNILWFSDEDNEYEGGVLKITDFGVTAFHNAKTTKQPAKAVPRTITYAAPEIEVSHDEDEPLVSRPFDVWSLGCVYLEFITWILLGSEGVLEFEQSRMKEKVTRKRFQEDSFYSIHRRGRFNPWSRDYGTVKTSVVAWTDTLRQNQRCTPFLKEFLDYIQTKMLVIKTKRETSAIVRAQLRRMLENCQQDRQYAESQALVQTGTQSRDTVHLTGSIWQKAVIFLCG
ncbi:hypothetical protein KVR01_002457 [Diaporthe batatas]|uniref:uncharacterized protein n=1 Tax=Diaporthe batatas TaxID=748121 RepID=UPI001D052945|nr:uncharacterized protein KVR01_002457 [Diaporthe batatas]KAG8166768.1 hypothetical protein KVR01_002457 [Diaporthe batatas]